MQNLQVWFTATLSPADVDTYRRGHRDLRRMTIIERGEVVPVGKYRFLVTGWPGSGSVPKQWCNIRESAASLPGAPAGFYHACSLFENGGQVPRVLRGTQLLFLGALLSLGADPCLRTICGRWDRRRRAWAIEPRRLNNSPISADKYMIVRFAADHG